jgi:hypothetical protein
VFTPYSLLVLGITDARHWFVHVWEHLSSTPGPCGYSKNKKSRKIERRAKKDKSMHLSRQERFYTL